MRFTAERFSGSEIEKFIAVSVELVGGSVSIPFDVSISVSDMSANGTKQL